MKKMISIVALLALGLSGVHADTYIVAEPGATGIDQQADLVAYLNANYTAGSLGTITLGTWDAGTLPPAGANDLIIVARDSNSGAYENNAAEVDSWNAHAGNMLLLNPWLTRDSRWGWVSGGVANLGTTGTDAAVQSVGHSLLTGVADPTDLYVDGDGTIQSSAVGTLGGGTQILSEDGNSNTILAHFAAGSALAFDNGGGSQTNHGGERIFFALGDEDTTSGINGLNANGLQILDNSLQHFGLVAIPEPATLGLFATFGGAVLFIRRRARM